MFASIFQPGNPYGGSLWRREHGALWDIGPHALSIILPVLGRVTRVAAMDGPSGLVHLLLTHDGGATSSALAHPGRPARGGHPGLRLLRRERHRDRPARRRKRRSPRSAPRSTSCVEEVDAGTRDHRCDVRFGREVVAVLAAAETARAEARTVELAA